MRQTARAISLDIEGPLQYAGLTEDASIYKHVISPMAEVLQCSVCEAPIEAAEAETCAECGELLRWFRSYFADVPKLDLHSIRPRTRFVDDLGLDSLDYVDWLLEAESVFGVRISDGEAERMRTVGDYLRRLRNESARWLPNQDIEIEKKSWGRRDWKVMTRRETI